MHYFILLMFGNIICIVFFRVIFGVFFLLNLVLWSKGSSAAIPFSTLIALLALWFGISVPLVFVGAYFGYKKRVRLNSHSIKSLKSLSVTHVWVSLFLLMLLILWNMHTILFLFHNKWQQNILISEMKNMASSWDNVLLLTGDKENYNND